MFRTFVSGLSIFALILTVGCGGEKHSAEEYQARIDALRAKGLPDNKFSSARVALYQANEHMSKGNKGLARTSFREAKEHLEKAEQFYKEQVSNLGPKIQAARTQALNAKGELTGYQARKIDSTVAVIDSFKRIDWLMQADNISRELVASLPGLREDEVKTKNLRRLVPGEWVTETRAKSESNRDVNALERKVFTFHRDGKVNLVESKRGQSGDFLKEDWEFRSWGTYDFKGDTIMLSINRFAAVRQDFERIHNINGNRVWVKEPQPRYDSTITDGSQDRFITFQDLKDDFRQARRF